MTRRLAIAGTPGTGKTEVARELARRGIPFLDLVALAEDIGAIEGVDAARGSRVVDEAMLADAFESVAAQLDLPVLACEGHFAHEMPVSLVVVLRAEPLEVVRRLAPRAWPEGKVRENAEAEAMGVVAWEAKDLAARRRARATEIDTTDLTVDEVADRILSLLDARGRLPPPDPGRFDVGSLPWI